MEGLQRADCVLRRENKLQGSRGAGGGDKGVTSCGLCWEARERGMKV